MEELDEILCEIKDDDNFEKVRDKLHKLYTSINDERNRLNKEVTELGFYKSFMDREEERRKQMEEMGATWVQYASSPIQWSKYSTMSSFNFIGR